MDLEWDDEDTLPCARLGTDPYRDVQRGADVGDVGPEGFVS